MKSGINVQSISITAPFVNMQTLAVKFPTTIYLVFSARQSNSGATVDGEPTMWIEIRRSRPSPLYWLTGGSKWAFEVQNPHLYKRGSKNKRKRKKGKQKHDFKLSLSIRPVLKLYETSGSLAVKTDTVSSNRSAELSLVTAYPLRSVCIPLDSLKKVRSLY